MSTIFICALCIKEEKKIITLRKEYFRCKLIWLMIMILAVINETTTLVKNLYLFCMSVTLVRLKLVSFVKFVT